MASWYETSPSLILSSRAGSSASESRLRTNSFAVPTDRLCAANWRVSSNYTIQSKLSAKNKKPTSGMSSVFSLCVILNLFPNSLNLASGSLGTYSTSIFLGFKSSSQGSLIPPCPQIEFKSPSSEVEKMVLP